MFLVFFFKRERYKKLGIEKKIHLLIVVRRRKKTYSVAEHARNLVQRQFILKTTFRTSLTGNTMRRGNLKEKLKGGDIIK